MKIEYLQISNVLSFKHYDDITEAPKVIFNPGLNILIGQNGAGKSTALEVINFIFKKIIFLPYNINQDLYIRPDITPPEKRNIIQAFNANGSPTGFRLEPNWDTESAEQKILIKVIIDDIDRKNLELLEENKQKLDQILGSYTQISSIDFTNVSDSVLLDITLSFQNNTSTINTDVNDPIFQYFSKYNLYKQLIEIHNRQNKTDQIPILQEPFTFITGYRNYSTFTPSISLSSEAFSQKQNIKIIEYNKSANSNDTGEPPIFNLVRLQIAEKHYNLIFTKLSDEEVTEIVNREPFLNAINEKLALINLKVRIHLVTRNSWSYTFNFFDTKRNRVLGDINSLSAGQKSIIHLIFESYGRGELKGGVVIIDEPEIHLHYQFQYEYLKIIGKINEEQKCQYILVTHSEALISSKTIDKVKRFALDENNNTIVKSPILNSDQKTLIKILDNTRSTYAFFAKKVILVEGDTDRYFFRSVFSELQPELNQEIAIIDIGGKGNLVNWRHFFEAFGLKVYYIGDFDNVFTIKRSTGEPIITLDDKYLSEVALRTNKSKNLLVAEKQKLKLLHDSLTADSSFLEEPDNIKWRKLIDYYKLITKVSEKEIINEVKNTHTNIDALIEQEYYNNIFILKKGTIEEYTGTQKKDLNAMIPFCENILSWLASATVESQEIKFIVQEIVK